VTKACLRIAIVDDEESVRKALMRLMRAVGLIVETFASGPEFLKSIETRLPDCVVLDLHMPHMNGFNVQAHLTRKYAALPVIIITGHDLPQARESAMAGGASAFLRKPVLEHILLDAIYAATSPAQPGASPNGKLNSDKIPQAKTN
jgi:FixJ family two-component response regulator